HLVEERLGALEIGMAPELAVAGPLQEHQVERASGPDELLLPPPLSRAAEALAGEPPAVAKALPEGRVVVRRPEPGEERQPEVHRRMVAEDPTDHGRRGATDFGRGRRR